MDLKTLSPILDGVASSVTQILKDTVGLPLAETGRGPESHPLLTQGLTVMVGVVGDLEGYVSISMSERFGVRYASKLLDVDVESWNEMVDSAIAELGNMVTAQTSMVLQERGHTCDVCPPTILVSEKIELGGQTTEVYVLRFKSEWGPMDVRLSLARPAVRLPLKDASGQPRVPPSISRILKADEQLQRLREMIGEGDLAPALDRAKKIIEAGFEVAPRVPAFLLKEARKLVGKGREGDALRLAQAALEFDPDLRAGHEFLGERAYQDGRFKESLEHYTIALSFDPEAPEIFLAIARCQTRLGEKKQAVRALNLAIEHGAGPEAKQLLDELAAHGLTPQG